MTDKLLLSLIVGTIVTRAPAAEMASTAFIELGLVIDAFEKAARDSRSRGSLVCLQDSKSDLLLKSQVCVGHPHKVA